MTFIVYLFLYTLSIGFATFSTKNSLRSGKNIWKYSSSYGLVTIFAFIVGTRYMVGIDYPEYMNIVQWGEQHHYYYHVEFIPRKIIDLVNALKLDFYWWFILMAFLQIFFIAKSVRGYLVKVFPWIIFSFLIIFLSSYMNLVRQGVALSCFLCAVTYAQERKLLPYLLFFLGGFLCHSSIIVWLPTYWLFNRELFLNIKVQYLLLIVSIFILPPVVLWLLEVTRPYWELFGYAHQAENFTGDEKFETLSSGFGVLLRYIRWCIIIAYYGKMKRYYGTSQFILFYNLFFIGICFDYSCMFSMLLPRIFMYSTFLEVIILPYLLYYLSKSKMSFDKIIFFILIVLLVIFPIYSIYSGVVEWKFVWDRFTYI